MKEIKRMQPGETIRSGLSDRCPDCGEKLEFTVLKSAAGYYVGTWCCCGPYTRESGYYRTREECQDAWELGLMKWRE